MEHICDDRCHEHGGPLTHDENGHSIVSERPIDPLVIHDESGKVIFRLRPDGDAEIPDPNKAPLAAAIFWREVINMARLLRVPLSFVEDES